MPVAVIGKWSLCLSSQRGFSSYFLPLVLLRRRREQLGEYQPAGQGQLPTKSCEEVLVPLGKLKSWTCLVHSGALRKTYFLTPRKNVVISQLRQFTTKEKNTTPELKFRFLTRCNRIFLHVRFISNIIFFLKSGLKLLKTDCRHAFYKWVKQTVHEELKWRSE